jgi:hypothetical protein
MNPFRRNDAEFGRLQRFMGGCVEKSWHATVGVVRNVDR